MARTQSTTPGYKARWQAVSASGKFGHWVIIYRDEKGNERLMDGNNWYSTRTSACRRCRQLNKQK